MRKSRSAMQTEEIRQAVHAAIASVAPEADVARLRPDQSLREQIDLDSMDWLNVIAALHERLAIEIPEADYGRLGTLDSMLAYLSSRQGRPPGAAAGEAAGIPASGSLHWVRNSAVRIRPMRREDMPMEADFVRHLSVETRYKRFMLTLSELSPKTLRYLTDVDQDRHVALVATTGVGGREVEVGVARYIVDPAGTGCEFAIAVADDWQGSGVAGILMHALIAVARSRGLPAMEGLVLRTNARMLRFAQRLGFELRRDPDDRDTVRVVRALR